MKESGTSDVLPPAVKIVVAGGFGVGKTTFIGAISEIVPLTTEATMTQAGAAFDDLSGLDNKTSTTVAFDFGRFTVAGEQIVYLFGTPGQQRFWNLWDSLSEGALGAIVLIDARKLENSFAAIDYFERRGTQFVIAANHFADGDQYHPDEIRQALCIGDHVPVIDCDARQRNSCKSVLEALVILLMRTTAAHADVR